MAIKFNHVTNTISFTSGACSASFVDSSATGIFETTGYARCCFVTTGQTGNFVTASQTGNFITTGQTGAFGGGGGGGTTLPNGTIANSAICWNGLAWTTGQSYVATGQTGVFETTGYARRCFVTQDQGCFFARIDEVSSNWTKSLIGIGADNLNLSYNGKIQVAANLGCFLVSDNFGKTWSCRSLPHSGGSFALEMSNDGSTMLLAPIFNWSCENDWMSIYISRNTGNTWCTLSNFNHPNPYSDGWSDIAISPDASKISAITHCGKLYYSSNSGITWATGLDYYSGSNPTFNPSAGPWWGEQLKMSSDGGVLAILTATPGGTENGINEIVYSSDSGNNWSIIKSGNIFGITMSDDGSKITAIEGDWTSNGYIGKILVSNDSGYNWTAKGPSGQWASIDMSSDGKFQIAGDYITTPGRIYISKDYGETWKSELYADGRDYQEIVGPIETPFEQALEVKISKNGERALLSAAGLAVCENIEGVRGYRFDGVYSYENKCFPHGSAEYPHLCWSEVEGIWTTGFIAGGGGSTLPNGTPANSALCWNGTSWVAAQTYVATGQTGNFSAHNLDFGNFNVTYKCNSNTISDSTGSAILEGSGNCIASSLNSQINNGCRNFISGACHNYIENGFCNCISGGNNIFSSILNGCCNRIVSNSCQVSILNGFCNCISCGIVGVIVGACCSLVCNGQAASVIGGVANQNCFSSRSVIVGGFNSYMCGSSTDAAIIAGNSNGMVGAVQSTVIGGVNNRLCHASTFLQTGNVIINGFLTRIGGCFNTNYNTIINTYCGCICSGSCNALINGTNSCLVSGASSSLIIGPSNTVCGYTGAIIIGSGITANAHNTLFVGNLRSTGIVSGNICGTGNFVTTSQTGAFALAAATGNFVTTSQTGCFITTGQTGAFGGGGGGTTLPNGTSTNSALCWNGSSWVAGQTYVPTGQTGNFLNTGAGYLGIKSIAESILINSSGAAGLINFDLICGSSLYYVGNATNNFSLNLRGSSTCTFSNLFPAFNSVSTTFIYNVGSTAYCLTGVCIDGSPYTVKWAGGGGNPSPELSAVNMYSITAIRTGASSSHWSLIGSLGFYS